MKLQDLFGAKNIIIQIVWGERNIEFPTQVMDKDSEGVYVTPYLHEGSPLELTINMNSGVICNIFGDEPENGKRVSWRNVDLSTVSRKGSVLYYLKTSSFNSVAHLDERRVEDRVVILRDATLIDNTAQKSIPIRIHDISDGGISFYSPANNQPQTSSFTVTFSDMVNEQRFNLNIKCKTVRTKKMPGTVFYGCRITEENNNFLLYGCLVRIKKNSGAEKQGEEKQGEEQGEK